MFGLFSGRSRELGDRSRELGDKARERRRWPEAAEHYRRHLCRYPQDFEIWVQCGHAEKEHGRFDAAEKCYAAAAAIRPQDADLALQRGHLAKLDGRLTDAIEAYLSALELDPNLEDAQRELQRLGYTPAASNGPGLLPLTELLSEQSLPIADPVLKLADFGAREVMMLRAGLLQEQGRFLEAAQVLRLVVRSDPEQREAWLELGKALLRAGDSEQAARCRTVAAGL